MALSDWVRETVSLSRKRSPRFTLKHAAHTFYIGALRQANGFFASGEPFWEGDWDVLVILDACRADMMRAACASGDYHWLPDPSDVDTVRSPGSTSDEWMAAMFGPDHHEEMADTAYITANMFVKNYDVSKFAAFCQVGDILEDRVGVTPPSAVTDRGIDVWRRRDELGVDKMILHYMQPHTPFRSRPEWFDETEMVTDWGRGFVRLRDGELNRLEFTAAYLDNLEWVLDDVDTLVENCEGDVVLSADHGNGLGEWGVYGHPAGMPTSALRTVPWVHVEGRDERTYEPALSAGYLDESRTMSEEEVSDRLEALGYKE